MSGWLPEQYDSRHPSQQRPHYRPPHGWHVIAHYGDTVTIGRGQPTSHTFHLLATVLTLGCWLPIWVLCCLFGGEKRRTIQL